MNVGNNDLSGDSKIVKWPWSLLVIKRVTKKKVLTQQLKCLF